MAITTAPTPNPNALKFNCGVQVGGPATYVAGKESDLDYVNEILALPGVTSLFLTADFITVSKSPDGDWDTIEPATRDILETAFPG